MNQEGSSPGGFRPCASFAHKGGVEDTPQKPCPKCSFSRLRTGGALRTANADRKGQALQCTKCEPEYRVDSGLASRILMVPKIDTDQFLASVQRRQKVAQNWHGQKHDDHAADPLHPEQIVSDLDQFAA